ncbi:uncharacterized protein PRCAT00004424001 [Priceomyces carsonii]|uniref:uncharacterized protein n=1 Tax=Priceomyces carsonii TaxID=28549 RepID=UPI002ED89E91|nr:unnamed protein product [Priceomyces carsonii]
MITALFIFDSKGDVLMSKLYKSGLKRNIADVFRIQVITSTSKSSYGNSANDPRSPVLTLGSTSFIYIRSGLLWICAVTRSNQDCSTILEFLYNLEALLRLLLIRGNDNKRPLTDETIINNFASIFELLDEVIDFGYPTNLELSYLKNLVTALPSSDNIFKLPSNVLRTSTSVSQVYNNTKKLIQNSLEITWRDSGIKYRRNEIFLNVEEKINVLMNKQGELLRAYVDGAIQMKTHLSGMPECQLGLGDDSILLGSLDAEPSLSNSGNVTLEDSKFHQCVELNKFDSKRIIQFVPPDGEFQLMSYHCILNVHLPFKVYSQVQELGKLKISYKIRIVSSFPSKIAATNVQLKIPTPKGALKSYSTNSGGKSKFHPEENVLIWKFNKFFGDLEHVLTAEVDFSGTKDNVDSSNSFLMWSRPPIKLEFVLDMFSCSGLTVKFLRVQEKTNYRTVKWVKYATYSGSYDIRY